MLHVCKCAVQYRASIRIILPVTGRGTTNVRRVSGALCEAVASNAAESDIEKQFSRAAKRCLTAKDRLLEAETGAQIEAAIRRVEILCDD